MDESHDKDSSLPHRDNAQDEPPAAEEETIQLMANPQT